MKLVCKYLACEYQCKTWKNVRLYPEFLLSLSLILCKLR